MVTKLCRNLILVLLLLSVSPPCRASSDTLAFSDKGISFNGKLLTLPCSQDEITALFGAPSDIVYAYGDEHSMTVIEWAHIGVFAYTKPATGVIDAVGVSLSPTHPERGFQKSFSGALLVDGVRLDMTEAGFRSAGFRRGSEHANWRRTLEPYYITVRTAAPDDPREIDFGRPSKN